VADVGVGGALAVFEEELGALATAFVAEEDAKAPSLAEAGLVETDRVFGDSVFVLSALFEFGLAADLGFDFEADVGFGFPIASAS
jgi:hypothetical protein